MDITTLFFIGIGVWALLNKNKSTAVDKRKLNEIPPYELAKNPAIVKEISKASGQSVSSVTNMLNAGVPVDVILESKR